MMKSVFIASLLVSAAGAALAADAPRPRSAILILGDGLGWEHLQLWREAARRKGIQPQAAALWEKGVVGVCTVRPLDGMVPESAGLASALAIGETVDNDEVSHTPDGREPPTILERAHAAGFGTGLVTTARITHGIPAPFLTHAADRMPEGMLARKIAATPFDVIFGGGANFFPPSTIRFAESQGYRILRTPNDLKGSEAKGRLFGVFTKNYFPFVIDRRPGEVPDLVDMIRTALDDLSKKDRFLLVIDVRLIDEASHINDAATMLREMEDFDRVVGFAMDFAKRRKDTLVVMTSPHDTGGPAVVYAIRPREWVNPSVLDRVFAQKTSFRKMFMDLWDLEKQGRTIDAAAVRSVVEPRLSPDIHLSDDEYAAIAEEYSRYPKIRRAITTSPASSELARALQDSYRIYWHTGTHTNLPVPLMAWGPGAGDFSGWLDAAEVSRRLMRVLGL